MTDSGHLSGTSSSASDSERWLPAMLLLFVGSGSAALIYEVVWLQLLQLVIGSSVVSLGVLLGTFMGGMCLGSLLLPRYLSRKHHPLKVYAYLELGIGVIGLLVLFLMPLLGSVYTAIGGSVFLRAIFAAICLLPPTLLMGATLPAVARWVEATPKGVSWLGFFYGGNIAGAVCGCLLAGFYLLRVYDMAIATYVAVALNVLVAALALGLSKMTSHQVVASQDDGAALGSPQRAEGASAVYVAIALSGLCALAAEVIWTRSLGLIFGATVYTFSLILAVFLVGLGLGSSAGSMLARNLANPRAALGWCQMLAAVALAWAWYMLSQSIPYWPINPAISSNIRFNFHLDVARAFFVVLPGALLWGASFPLALASVATRGQDTGRLVGGVYAANTVGAIVGALVASLLMVWWLGTQNTQRILIGLSALSGLIVLTPVVSGGDGKGAPFQWVAALVLIVVTGAVGLLARNAAPMPWLLVAYGRYSATWLGQSDVIYMGEGLTSSVAVSQMSNGVRNYHNAGKVQASSEPQDMRLQRMLGHLTTLVPANPKTALVIGCGAGVTAGAVSISPQVLGMTIAEIEPLVPGVVSKYFATENYSVVTNPKVTIDLDDARHFLLTTDQKFDAITSDPLDPWVKGAATLYTKEFFDVVKQHLNPGGVVTLFVQLYESNPAAVKSEIATFFESFPNGMVFGNTHNGQGYDLVLLGQVEQVKIDVDDIQRKLSSPEFAQVAQSLREVGFTSAVELLATYGGSATDLKPWLADAMINRDRNLRLQYLAGLGLNLYESARIYADMQVHTKYPENLFTGSPETLEALRAAFARVQGR